MEVRLAPALGRRVNAEIDFKAWQHTPWVSGPAAQAVDDPDCGTESMSTSRLTAVRYSRPCLVAPDDLAVLDAGAANGRESLWVDLLLYGGLHHDRAAASRVVMRELWLVQLGEAGPSGLI